MPSLGWMIGAFLALVTSHSASATATVDHVLVGSRTEFLPGEAFQVQVRASWDGQGSLAGLFSSTGVIAGDPTAVVAESAGFQAGVYRGSLFPFVDDAAGIASYLARFGGNRLRQLGDPTDVARSVQYGSIGGNPLDPRGAASSILITTITYRIMSFGGTIMIGSLRALGDTGPIGDVAGIGSNVTISVIPEPGAGILIALGLAGLGLKRARIPDPLD